MSSQYIKPFRSDIDHEDVRIALRQAWTRCRAGLEPNEIGVSIMMAQTALETAEFASSYNWNLGGVKASEDVPHTYVSTIEWMARERARGEVARASEHAPCKIVEDNPGLTEVVVRYYPNHPTCRFRAYASLGEAAFALVSLKCRKYPKAVTAAAEGDLRGYVTELRRGGYFTAPLGDYIAGVERMMLEYALPCLSNELEIGAALELLGYDVAADYKQAVADFQEAHKLRADGVVGKDTRTALRRLIVDDYLQ
jgi:hypothetical protein